MQAIQMGLERMTYLLLAAPPIGAVSGNFPATEGGRIGWRNKTWTTLPPPLFGVILQGTTLVTNFWDHKLFIYLISLCSLQAVWTYMFMIVLLFAFAFAWYLMDINALQTHVHRILYLWRIKRVLVSAFALLVFGCFSFFYISFVPQRIFSPEIYIEDMMGI